MQGFDSKLNCATCPDRPKCEQRGTLCAEAERYVNQDHRRHNVRAVKMENIDILPSIETPTALMGVFEKKLSPREKQVALFLMEGHSTRQIAQLLGIKRRTVREHIKRIGNKMVQGGVGYITKL